MTKTRPSTEGLDPIKKRIKLGIDPEAIKEAFNLTDSEYEAIAKPKKTKKKTTKKSSK